MHCLPFLHRQILFTGFPPKLKNFVKFKNVQIMVTNWIISSISYYKERLTKLNSLPLSLYVDMQDLLRHPSKLSSKCEISTDFKNLMMTKLDSSVGESTRLSKSDDNYFH